MNTPIPYEHGIYAIDAEYVRPQLAAIHLIVENGRAAFVDTGTNHALPRVLEALKALGLTPDSVDHVILTHIHLDHAGGAGGMLQCFPNAQLVVHPRGARHMADPRKLVEGSVGVYGEAAVRRLYGEVLPIDPQRIVEATHGSTVSLAGRELLCLDTPGHARHHIAIVDPHSGHIFAGDNFGVSYRELDTADGRQFIFPTTTPVQFDPLAMHATIDLLVAYQPAAMYLTHFGQVRDIAAKAAVLHRQVESQVNIARQAAHAGAERHAIIRAGLSALLLDELAIFGAQKTQAELLALFENDIELNAQGLGVWLASDK